MAPFKVNEVITAVRSPPSSSEGVSTDLLPMGLLKDALAAVLHPSSPSPFQLVFSSHPAWPRPVPGASTQASRRTSPSQQCELKISCLDSSFNPPTLAHRALATAPYPGAVDAEDDGYDAHLLLLSVKNVDKTLQSGDADYKCGLIVRSRGAHVGPSSVLTMLAPSD